MPNQKEKKSSVIESVTKPLGFFVLALLIVETFLATVLIFSGIKEENKMIGLWIGISLFVVIIMVVSILVWFKPRNLMYDQFGHLADSGKILYGSPENPMNLKTLNSLPQSEEK